MRCEVSLPQNCTPECEVLRNAALATNKKSFSLTHPPEYGFARTNITPDKLAPLLLGDPFSRYYTSLYINTVKANNKALEKYNKDSGGQEINDLSEYLRMTEFFQPLLEPLIGVNTFYFCTSVRIVIAIVKDIVAFIVNFVIVFAL